VLHWTSDSLPEPPRAPQGLPEPLGAYQSLPLEARRVITMVLPHVSSNIVFLLVICLHVLLETCRFTMCFNMLHRSVIISCNVWFKSHNLTYVFVVSFLFSWCFFSVGTPRNSGEARAPARGPVIISELEPFMLDECLGKINQIFGGSSASRTLTVTRSVTNKWKSKHRRQSRFEVEPPNLQPVRSRRSAMVLPPS